MNTHSPSLLRIVQIDYWSCLTGLLAVVFWGFYAWDVLVKKSAPTFFLTPVLVATGLAVIVIVTRAAALYNLYAVGVETRGTVESAGFFRDRGRIHLLYDYQGGRYLSRMLVMKTKRTTAFEAGQPVTLLVDPNHPKRAVVRDLFL